MTAPARDDVRRRARDPYHSPAVRPRHLRVVRPDARAPAPAPRPRFRDDLMWLPLVGPLFALGVFGLNAWTGLLDLSPVTAVIAYAAVVLAFVVVRAVLGGDR